MHVRDRTGPVHRRRAQARVLAQHAAERPDRDRAIARMEKLVAGEEQAPRLPVQLESGDQSPFRLIERGRRVHAHFDLFGLAEIEVDLGLRIPNVEFLQRQLVRRHEPVAARPHDVAGLELVLRRRLAFLQFGGPRRCVASARRNSLQVDA
ncbi:MAG: hypothetical protein ACYS0E_20600 [Planctomycetota bacterium]